MVKLIRITSEDNGNYNAELQDGILLEPKSSIALQNLTFESDFIGLNINSLTNQVEFNLDVGTDQTGIPPQPPTGYQPTPPFTKLTATLDTKQYTKNNYKEFYADLQGALNSCLAVGTGASENYGDIYSEFFVDALTNPDRPKIYYKYTPQIMMFHMNDSTPRPPQGETEMFLKSEDANGDETLVVDNTVTAPLLGNIQQIPAGVGTNALINYVIPNFNSTLSRGSAVYGCSVYNLDDTQPGNPGEHGFAIGLSFTKDINSSLAMPTTHRDFEIHVEKGNQGYKYISPSIPHTEQNSTVIPFRFNITDDTNYLTHDRIIFERKAGVITGCIWATGTTAVPGTAIRHELFSYTLTNEERKLELYPYLYVKGSALNCTVGRPFLTPSSLIYDKDLDEEFLNMDYEVTGQLTTVDVLNGQNYFQNLVSGFESIIPYINNSRMTLDIKNKPTVTLNGYVLRFLGWDVTGNGAINIVYPETQILRDSEANELGFILEGDQNTQLVNSDNYVVVIDSNPVMSYDASRFSYGAEPTVNSASFNQMKGRQYNILATIAVNDNAGYLEWRANELVYIDFDNKYPLELKNLRLRVLDKELNPIKQIGLGVITLLIKDK